MLGYVMDGKCDVAWTGLVQKIDVQKISLKLVAGSERQNPNFQRAVTNGVDSGRI